MLDFFPEVSATAQVIAVTLLVVLASVGFLAFIVRRGRKRELVAPPVDLLIDVATLGEAGPLEIGPRLELYNVPVRLAAIVYAPLGRGETLPVNVTDPAFAEAIVPGLGTVVGVHRPLMLRWPQQVSWQGFIGTFHSNVHLPGDKGKRTPWCSLAGRFEVEGKKYLVGMVLRADSANSLGQMIAEREHQWLDMLRIRSS